MKLIKLLLLTTLLLATGQQAAAQISISRNIRLELWDGFSLPISGASSKSSSSKLSMSLGGSVRYSFPQTPFNMGVYGQVDYAKREYTTSTGAEYTTDHRTTSFGIVGGWNLTKWAWFSPYASCSLGVAMRQYENENGIKVNSTGVSLIPRVGFDLFHYIRLSAYLQISERNYNTYGFMVGLNI